MITVQSSPATQRDVQEVLQQEQEHAMSLLSSSPLLSSLFISYATRISALESSSPAPPLDDEERKALQSSIIALKKVNEKLELEHSKVVRKLEAGNASQEAFRSQMSFLEDANATQREENKTLRRELVEVKCLYDQFVTDSNAEKTAHRVRIMDLEVR